MIDIKTIHSSRMWFFLFVMCVAINCSFTLYFACYCIAIEGIQLLYVLGLLEAFVFCMLGWILTCTSVSQTQTPLIVIFALFNITLSLAVFADSTRLHELDYQ